jgi:hypothetical protein
LLRFDGEPENSFPLVVTNGWPSTFLEMVEDQYNAGDVERARLEPGGDDPTAASLTSR